MTHEYFAKMPVLLFMIKICYYSHSFAHLHTCPHTYVSMHDVRLLLSHTTRRSQQNQVHKVPNISHLALWGGVLRPLVQKTFSSTMTCSTITSTDKKKIKTIFKIFEHQCILGCWKGRILGLPKYLGIAFKTLSPFCVCVCGGGDDNVPNISSHSNAQRQWHRALCVGQPKHTPARKGCLEWDCRKHSQRGKYIFYGQVPSRFWLSYLVKIHKCQVKSSVNHWDSLSIWWQNPSYLETPG